MGSRKDQRVAKKKADDEEKARIAAEEAMSEEEKKFRKLKAKLYTQENRKCSPRGSTTEPRRVQNGVPEGPKWSPEGPKWSPMGQDGGQQGAQCHPKGLREAQVPL